MFVKPGVPTSTKARSWAFTSVTGDLKVNVCKKKAATNVRSNKDATVVLNESKELSLDDCVEYIAQDELVEVTPLSIRICKNTKMKTRNKKN